MAGRPNGNGNGRGGRKNGGAGGDVPRWVRTLFDDHQRRMHDMERKRREDKAAHEERMDEIERHNALLERAIQLQENRVAKLEEDRKTFVAEITRVDAEGKAVTASMIRTLQAIHGRVSRLEGGSRRPGGL